VTTMARWERLYHDWVARLFARGLYSGRFAVLCPAEADFPGGHGVVKFLGHPGAVGIFRGSNAGEFATPGSRGRKARTQRDRCKRAWRK
jgi:hypothetical protein